MIPSACIMQTTKITQNLYAEYTAEEAIFKNFRQHCTWFCPVQCFRESSCAWATSMGFYMCNVDQQYYENTEQDFFLWNVVWSFLDNIGQHCTRLLPVQCCPKNIKTTLNVGQDFFLCIIVWSLLDNTAQGFYQCNVVSRVLIQHCTVILHVQCCLEPLEEHCTGFLPVNCWPMDNRQLFLAKIQNCVYQAGTIFA